LRPLKQFLMLLRPARSVEFDMPALEGTRFEAKLIKFTALINFFISKFKILLKIKLNLEINANLLIFLKKQCN
jgi:hypothetical protein